MSIAYITHQKCQLHDMGSYHPEQPARLSAINDRLIATGLDMVLRQHDAEPATREQLLAAHDEAYVDSIFRKSPEMGLVEASHTPSKALIAVFSNDGLGECHALARELRAEGLPVEVYLGAAKLKKQFKYANAKGIDHVLVVGPDELAAGEVQVKTLATGDQRRVARGEVAALLRG